MKNLFVTALAVFAMIGLSFQTKAQENNKQTQSTYVKIKGGYGWGVAKDGYYVDMGQGSSIDGQQEQIFTSLGGGTIAGFAIGHFFTDHLGAELDFTYLKGAKQNVQNVSVGGVTYQSADAYTNQYRLAPTIIMSTGNSKTLSLYTKVGFVLPMGGYAMVESSSLDPSTANAIEIEQKINGDFSIGFTGVLGVQYRLNDKFAMFAELEGVYLNIKRKKSTIETFTVNGVDQLDNFTAITGQSVNVDYVDTVDSTNPDPSKALKTTSPYSKQGINIGLTYYF
ncbi:porin family protein [Halosquirtibacter laminarini]|uniref:Porin family protein n=1 Tax=Halosquirtibacter laminarini TaxID=3374600 RepID=A0AC61NBW2_9BACT|nr:porin family protein [Prolixibacteraceae bacterium]